MRTYLIASFVLVAALVTVSAAAKAQEPKAAVCKVDITDPKPGTSVGPTGTATGVGQIPASSHLWVLAHKKTLNGWWPQGGGETMIKNGQWGPIDVTYGVASDKGEFEIAVVAVGDDANKELNKWIDQAPASNYPPMRFPATTEGCSISRVTVVKP